jgi:chromosome segregation ATPase
MSIGYCSDCEKSGGHSSNCPRVTGKTRHFLEVKVEQLQAELAAKDEEIGSLSESFDGIKNVLHDTQRELISVKSIAGKWQEKAMEWSRKNAELTNELQVNDQDRDLVANIIKSVPEVTK